jgi:hypothetical protein
MQVSALAAASAGKQEYMLAILSCFELKLLDPPE